MRIRLYFTVHGTIVIFAFLYFGLSENNDVVAQNINSKYTLEESVALSELRKIVQNDLKSHYMKDEWYLLRWLRGNRLNANITGQKLLKVLEWRKEYNADRVLDEILSKDVTRASSFFIDGLDNDGNPVLSVDLSQLDIRRFVITGRRNDVLRNFIRMWETVEMKLFDIRNETNQDITKVVAIFDVSGYNRIQHACLNCFGVYLEYMTAVTNYYSGILKHVYLINAPRSFSALAEFLKRLMPEQAKEIFDVYGINKREWSPKLFENIRPDSIRSKFGGTKI